MNEEIKILSIRLPKEMHKWLKIQAYTEGMTIQEYIFKLLQCQQILVAQEAELTQIRNMRNVDK